MTPEEMRHEDFADFTGGDPVALDVRNAFNAGWTHAHRRAEPMREAAAILFHEFGDVADTVSFLALPEMWPTHFNRIVDAMNAFEKATRQ